MAYKPVVQRYAPGLLGWLGIKNGGQNPVDLGSQIMPVFDALSWYLMDDAEVVAVTITAPTVGVNSGFPTMTVPPGEWWYVHDHSIRLFATGAGDTVTACAAALITTGLNTAVAYAGDYRSNPPGVASFTTVGTSRKGFFLRPGEQLIAMVDSLVGTVRITAGALITRLPV